MRRTALGVALAAALSTHSAAVEIEINFGYPLLFESYDGVPDFFGSDTPASVVGSFTFDTQAALSGFVSGFQSHDDALIDFQLTVFDATSTAIGGFQISDVDDGATVEAGGVVVRGNVSGGLASNAFGVVPNVADGSFSGALSDDGVITIILQALVLDDIFLDFGLTQFESSVDLQAQVFDAAAAFPVPDTISSIDELGAATTTGGRASLGLVVDDAVDPDGAAVFANAAPVVVPVPPALPLLAGGLLALGLAARRRRQA